MSALCARLSESGIIVSRNGTPRKEGQIYEGETDDRGHYLAKINLAADHTELRKNDYERFQDLTLVAYFTDSSTGRTEQKHFDVRITKDPVHVYMMRFGVTKRIKIPPWNFIFRRIMRTARRLHATWKFIGSPTRIPRNRGLLPRQQSSSFGEFTRIVMEWPR